MFWFQALRKPRFENKGIFLNKVCFYQNIRIMAHSQANIRIMAHPQGGICIMTYLQEDIRIFVYPKGHVHHDIPIKRHSHLYLCEETFAS